MSNELGDVGMVRFLSLIWQREILLKNHLPMPQLPHLKNEEI